MQPDIDAQLSNFFEETPQRDFARVMRGYDPHQVNEHLKQIDSELRQHRDQVQALHSELSEAHRQIQEQERPTYSGLGSRIEQLLRLAEEQATEILQEARSAANEFGATAKVEAAEVRAAAENEAAELRANAKRETDDAITYLLSDHFPIWMKLKTDNDKEKRDQLIQNLRMGDL